MERGYIPSGVRDNPHGCGKPFRIELSAKHGDSYVGEHDYKDRNGNDKRWTWNAYCGMEYWSEDGTGGAFYYLCPPCKAKNARLRFENR